ncbi:MULTISPECIES: pyridoxal phosphate-dependent aminotransferase [Actinosynnema]|uniref:pyridoxal phosphate-dependent aminotransferase n=1 Tax=Actinosynnema TaxID=40566 RepID=UPI0020A40592|nr:pyridoxal phosphate-dependent aminotransferase [Actinosynnema pretiosum]MCP2092331.1 aspartate aminotransferase [Actinosynnema pretiosum]
MLDTVIPSATLAADAVLAARRAARLPVTALASGEIGLPVHPLLIGALVGAAHHNGYGPVAGSAGLRAAAAGHWSRRGLPTDPDLVVVGPGSKPLLYALLLAIGGDVVIPAPGWVSYAAHAGLAGARAVPVPTRPGEGGVPDPELLRAAVRAARSRGRTVRSVVVTVPDNPTGTVASAATVEELAVLARELDLVVVSDEIYRDLAFDGAPVSPAEHAPERTVVTTGLTKSHALGGWRVGVARLPDAGLRERLLAVAGHVWSSTNAPAQAAAQVAFDEPPELVARVAAARGLHAAVAGALRGVLVRAGAEVAPVRATCYLYPDLAPLREALSANGLRTDSEVVARLLERHGVGVLPGSAFGEAPERLRLRLSTSHLYGDDDARRLAALDSGDPAALPWVSSALDRVAEAFADLVR